VAAHAPTYHVVGATIPGLPVVILGHTPRVAWGLTNAMVDDVDLVAEQLSADSNRFRTPGGWVPVTLVAETIAVRGGSPVVYARRRTSRGPLVTNEGVLDSGRAYAMRWAAQDAGPGGDEIGALRAMAQAEDAAGIEAAARRFHSPQQHVVYADTAGRIGYLLAGRVPRRRRGDSPFPSDGTLLAGDPWAGWLAPGALPGARDPASGWIVTANNRMATPAQRAFLSRHYDLPYRAQRIAELLEIDTAATAASASRHQGDVLDPFARRAKSIAARAALAVGRPDVADRLRAWDGTMDASAAEPTLFWRWYRHVEQLTFDETPGYQPPWPLHRWMAQGGSPWFDVAATAAVETLDSIATLAMARVLADRGAAPWGVVHTTVMRHPLGGVPVLGRLVGFAVGPLPAAGDDYTVNNATTWSVGPPFESSYGPSLRHVVDLGNVDGVGGFILPSGQSGHPLSPHYRDQTARWLAGELWVLPTDPGRVAAADTLVLIPGEGR
jgi:penicillin amidase